MRKEELTIAKPQGKLGILVVGICGAVATTFVAGTLAVRKGCAQPIGALTQMGRIRLGNRSENRMPLIRDVVPLADLDDLVLAAGTCVMSIATTLRARPRFCRKRTSIVLRRASGNRSDARCFRANVRKEARGRLL
jgi:hypothetical protein